MINQGVKARALGINHVVLEVGSIDEALEFYSGILDFKLRGRVEGRLVVVPGRRLVDVRARGRAGGRGLGGRRGRVAAPEHDEEQAKRRQPGRDTTASRGRGILPAPLRGDRALWLASARTSWKRGCTWRTPAAPSTPFPSPLASPRSSAISWGGMRQPSRKGRRRRGDEDGGHRQGPGPPYERPPNSQTGRLEPVTA